MILCPFSREPCLIESCELFINHNGEGGCVFRFLQANHVEKNHRKDDPGLRERIENELKNPV
jgi:hypothetical protein